MPPGLTTCPSTLTPIPASTFSHLGPASHSPPCLHPCLSILHREARMFFKNGIQMFRSSSAPPPPSRIRCRLCIMACKTLPLLPHLLPSFTRFQRPNSLGWGKVLSSFPQGVCTCCSLSLECSFLKRSLVGTSSALRS